MSPLDPLAVPDDPRPDTPAPDGPEAPEGSRWAKAHHVLLYFLAGGLVIWLLTGFYKVDANEVAIVERLGQYVGIERHETIPGSEKERIIRIAEEQVPGQHYGLPWPFDVIHRVPKQTQTVEVKDFWESSPETKIAKEQIKLRKEESQASLDSVYDPYLITADKNALHAKAVVQYQIDNAADYLRSMAHSGRDTTHELEAARAAIGQVALHAMIQEFAKTPVDRALREGQQELKDRIVEAMRPDIDRLGLGVKVSTMTLEVYWPPQVDDAFKSATAAPYYANALINEARAYAERLVQQAEKGEKAKLMADAQAYRDRTLQEARNEAERLTQLYKRYQEAPEITRLSLYTDAINAVLSNATRTLFVPRGETATIILDPPEDKPKPAPRDGAGPPR